MKCFCNVYRIVIIETIHISMKTTVCTGHYTKEIVTALSKQTEERRTKALSSDITRMFVVRNRVLVCFFVCPTLAFKRHLAGKIGGDITKHTWQGRKDENIQSN